MILTIPLLPDTGAEMDKTHSADKSKGLLSLLPIGPSLFFLLTASPTRRSSTLYQYVTFTLTPLIPLHIHRGASVSSHSLPAPSTCTSCTQKEKAGQKRHWPFHSPPIPTPIPPTNLLI